MRIIKILFILLILLMNSGQDLFAIEEPIRLYRGIRSMSMGGIVTTTGNYAEALFGNPARHSEAEDWKWSILDVTATANENIIYDSSEIKDITEGSASSTLIGNISPIIGRNQHARVDALTAFYHPNFIGNLGFAFGFLVSSYANLLLQNTTDVDTQMIVHAGPSMGFSHPFLDNTLLVGVNIHVLYRAASDEVTSSLEFLTGERRIRLTEMGEQGIGVDADLGLFYRIPFDLPDIQISIGASLSGVVKSHYDEIPQALLEIYLLAPLQMIVL